MVVLFDSSYRYVIRTLPIVVDTGPVGSADISALTHAAAAPVCTGVPARRNARRANVVRLLALLLGVATNANEALRRLSDGPINWHTSTPRLPSQFASPCDVGVPWWKENPNFPKAPATAARVTPKPLMFVVWDAVDADALVGAALAVVVLAADVALFDGAAFWPAVVGGDCPQDVARLMTATARDAQRAGRRTFFQGLPVWRPGMMRSSYLTSFGATFP